MSERTPRLLIVSMVLPFPGNSGQQQRVFYKLKAFRKLFHVTFLTVCRREDEETTREQLQELCDAVILLPSRYSESRIKRSLHRVSGLAYQAVTGLKFSNYLAGSVELSPARIKEALSGEKYDVAVFEYWHAVGSVPAVRESAPKCVLDTHNILWQSYAMQMESIPYLPAAWKNYALRQYRKREEKAWRAYDGLIAINAAEKDYIIQAVPAATKVFFAPMGTDLDRWPYSWAPTLPPRLAYYGGLGSKHNQADALFCYERVMPEVWKVMPAVELWLIGSNPPESIRAIQSRDQRVIVTGFVKNAAEVLKSMSAVICPWSGTYGFRSRLVEVMALGIPVIASTEATYGMGLADSDGVLLRDSAEAMATASLQLLADQDFAKAQSRRANETVRKRFSFEATYGHLATELAQWAMN